MDEKVAKDDIANVGKDLGRKEEKSKFLEQKFKAAQHDKTITQVGGKRKSNVRGYNYKYTD